MRHTYTAEHWLPYPVETVFDFFADPENLPRLMPEWQQARIDTASIAAPPWRPGKSSSSAQGHNAAGAGSRMTITFLPFPHAPFRVPWDAEITEFEWNSHFCDIQHRGPFTYWKHCHGLEPQLRGALEGTMLRDHVEYELPFGPLGDLANSLFVKRQMQNIFDYRQRRTTELLPRAASSRTP